MKLTITLAALAVLAISQSADAQVMVDGYFRSNGTYVQPYTRSMPSGNPYSSPYTVQPTYIAPPPQTYIQPTVPQAPQLQYRPSQQMTTPFMGRLY